MTETTADSVSQKVSTIKDDADDYVNPRILTLKDEIDVLQMRITSMILDIKTVMKKRIKDNEA